MSIQVSNNKSYKVSNFSDELNIFSGYYDVDEDILKRLCRDLGFSYDLYETLNRVSKDSADTVVKSMSEKSNHPAIALLLDESKNKIINYSLDYERFPVLNSEFVNRINSLAETSDSIEVAEICYHPEDTTSSIILKKKDPIVIEEKYMDKESEFINYHIGVALFNEEMTTTYSRLVLYVDDHPLYLPASYYNATASRYKRATASSVEALEVLALKVIDDLRENALYNKIYELHFRYKSNKSILASYEEYNTVLRTMRKIPSIIEDNSFLDTLVNEYEEFEQKYYGAEDQSSSYIWRCTALGEITIGSLVHESIKILNTLSAPGLEYFSIRELLGSYISTNRIAEEIAKETIK